MHRRRAVPVFAGCGGCWWPIFGGQKVAVTHPCICIRCFRMAEPGRTVMGCHYHRRRMPCWVCVFDENRGDFTVAVRRNFWRWPYFVRGDLFSARLKSERNHYLNPFKLTNTLVWRLCPWSPDPYHWKAEILRFLYVSLVWGVKVTSLLTTFAQSYCFVLEYSFFANVKKER